MEKEIVAREQKVVLATTSLTTSLAIGTNKCDNTLTFFRFDFFYYLVLKEIKVYIDNLDFNFVIFFLLKIQIFNFQTFLF